MGEKQIKLENFKKKIIKIYKRILAQYHIKKAFIPTAVRLLRNSNFKSGINSVNRENFGDMAKIYGISANTILESKENIKIYMELEEYEKVIEECELQLEILPNAPNYWLYQGCAYYGLKKYEEAMKCLEKALEFHPYQPRVYYYKSLIYSEWNDIENAYNMIKKALEISPEKKLYLFEYANILLKLNRPEESLDIANDILNDKPNSINAFLIKAHSLERLGKYEEALKCYDDAILIDSYCVDLWNDKSFVLIKLERYEEALECLYDALKLSPNESSILLNLAKCYKDKGDFNNAQRYYEEAISFNLDNEVIFEEL